MRPITGCQQTVTDGHQSWWLQLTGSKRDSNVVEFYFVSLAKLLNKQSSQWNNTAWLLSDVTSDYNIVCIHKVCTSFCLGHNDRGCAGIVFEAPKGSGGMMQSKPWACGCFTNDAQAARSLFPLKQQTHKFSIFSLKIMPHNSCGILNRGHFVQRDTLTIVTPSILK